MMKTEEKLLRRDAKRGKGKKKQQKKPQKRQETN